MLQITLQQNNLIAFNGELNFTAVNAAIWEQSKTLIDVAATDFSVDFSGVSSSDSTGVALLVSWVRHAKSLNKTIHFIHIPKQMLAIIRVSGLEKLINC